jgi:branched-chain amino acid aminotransferase
MKTDFGTKDFAAFCREHRPGYHADYYAMYSSWWNGITTEPNLMVVPVDDHMVHRGDGLFETFKCVDGAVYNLDAHMARLENGAKAIALQMPWSRGDIRRIIGEVLKAGGRRRVLAIRLPPPFMASHPDGARVGLSAVPNKEGMFAQVKSVNYLPNVLMKKQAVDAGVDFMLGFDKDGHMTELPTENFGIVTTERVLKVPRPDHILAGTTMGRVLALARDHLVPAGVLAGVEEADVPRAELETAAEMLVFGTSPHVTAVTEFAGRLVGDGMPGPVWRELSRLFEADLKNPAMLTPVV